jgi:hypothetical protein
MVVAALVTAAVVPGLALGQATPVALDPAVPTPAVISVASDPQEMANSIDNTPAPQATGASPADILSIRAEPATIVFGTVDANGGIFSDAPPETEITVDSAGAFYVLPGAVTILVEGTLPWRLVCSATGENVESDALIARGQLQWRHAGNAGWRSFTDGQEDPTCPTDIADLSTIVVLDIGLRVGASDPPGRFAATIEVRVEQV